MKEPYEPSAPVEETIGGKGFPGQEQGNYEDYQVLEYQVAFGDTYQHDKVASVFIGKGDFGKRCGRIRPTPAIRLRRLAPLPAREDTNFTASGFACNGI